MKNMLLINKDELLTKLRKRIELFNIKDRIPDRDTRNQIVINVMNVIKNCDKLKND